MARKRLNKKVALIGSAVFAVVMVVLILAVLYLSRDPERFIKDGHTALMTARKAVDKQTKLEMYEQAARSYHRARARAKDDSLRVDILFKLVDLYIEMDRYAETDQWRYALGCWDRIIRVDPANIKALYGRLKYFYITADGGANQIWQKVKDQASEFIDVVEKAGLLMEDTAKWQTTGMPTIETRQHRLGPYLYLVRARANLELARLGAVTDPNGSLTNAENDLEKVLQLEPENIDAYWYLARTAIEQGELFAATGNLEQRDQAEVKAKKLLEKAVEVAGNDPIAHINLLSMKFLLAQRIGKEQIRALEPEYLALIDRFPSNPDAFSAISLFYSDPRLGPEYLDKAIEAAEQAIRLEPNNVAYAIHAARLHYRMFSYHGQKDHLYKAIKMAKNALTLPQAQEKGGPRSWANRINRISLYGFLAGCYIEQVLEPCEARTDSETSAWLKNAEQAVHNITQIVGTGGDPQVIKWRGMLELARGNRDAAIRKLYTAYEQYKAANRTDARLSYALAKVFKDSPEIGAVTEFLVSALNANIALTKPQARLDYVDILLKLKAWTAAISNIISYEDIYGPNDRTRILRIRAYIGANQFDEAEEELAKLQPNDPNTIKLMLQLEQARIRQVRTALARKKMQQDPNAIFIKATRPGEGEPALPETPVPLMKQELNSYLERMADWVEKLLTIEPNSVQPATVAGLCQDYIKQGRIGRASEVVELFLQYFPDNPDILIYKQILAEPQPGNVSSQRRKQIQQQVLSNISEPLRRSARLGIFYHRNNELEKAAANLKKALQTRTSPKKEQANLQRVAAEYLFDIAVRTRDWQLAQQVVHQAQQDDLDGCQGQVYQARLAAGKSNFKDALTVLNQSLKQKPVFSRGYALRSKVNAALGNEHAAMADIQKAAALNPLDGAIAKTLAISLYRRNQKLGYNVSSEQRIEARRAFQKAVILNPSDLQLLNVYAEYVGQTEPENELTIRQTLQKISPNLDNATRLGQVATKLAVEEKNPQRREALFNIAAASFEQAWKLEPYNKQMLYSYAEYYRARGMVKKAEQLIQQSKDQDLLWKYYYQRGELEQAQNVLEKLYSNDPQDSTVVRNLLLIGEKAKDLEAVKKYSEELISIQDHVENRLLQIQTFLKVGLLPEAERKLQIFKEKYPEEPRANLLQAWLTMRKGQLEKALKLTNQNLTTDQSNAQAWKLRGQINLLMANYDQAISDLKRSKLLSDEPDTRLALARAYLRAGRNEDAITELSNMMDLPSAPIEARTLVEQIYWNLGRKGDLRRFYEDTLKKYPNSVPWYNRAGAFAISEGDFERAEKLYKQAFTRKRREYPEQETHNRILDPQYATAFDGYLQALVLGAGLPNARNKGWNPSKLGTVFEEGKKFIDGAFAPIAYYRMAEAKLKLGDKQTAVQYCRNAVDKSKNNETLASEILLRMFLLLGPDEVSKYCRQKLITDPNSLAANWTMFNLAKIKTDYEQAVGYLDKCIEIAGPNTPRGTNYSIKKAEVLTLAYDKTSDNKYLVQAVREYESLLVKMPNNTNVLNNLAYMLAQNDERLPEALEYAKRAAQAGPDRASFLDTYAYVLYKNNKLSQAAETAVAAMQQYEQSGTLAPAEVYEHMGLIQEKLGAKEKALAAYQQALEIGADRLSKQDSERLKAAIERLSP